MKIDAAHECLLLQPKVMLESMQIKNDDCEYSNGIQEEELSCMLPQHPIETLVENKDVNNLCELFNSKHSKVI